MKVVRRVANQSTKTAVRELMTKSIVSGDPRQSLVAAAAKMRAHRISALAVLDGEAIVGILTERDLVRHRRWPRARKDARFAIHDSVATDDRGRGARC